MSRQIGFPFLPSLRMPPVCVRCGQPAGAGTIEVKGGGSDTWGKHYEFATMHFPVCPACEAYAAGSKRQRKEVARSVEIELKDVSRAGYTHVQATFHNESFAALFLQANVDLFAAAESAIAEKREKSRWHKDDWLGVAALGVIAVLVSLFLPWATKAKIDAPKFPVVALLLLSFGGIWLLSAVKTKGLAVLGSASVLAAGVGIAWVAASYLGLYESNSPGGLWWCAIGSWAMVIGGFAMTLVSAIWGPVWSRSEKPATTAEGQVAGLPPPLVRQGDATDAPSMANLPPPSVPTPSRPDL